jgi:hypothetical protein
MKPPRLKIGAGYRQTASPSGERLGRLLSFFHWDERTSAVFHFFKGRLTVLPRTFPMQ